MTFKRALEAILPPFVWKTLKVLNGKLRTVDSFEYAPQGWATALPAGANRHEYWTRFIAQERVACEALIGRVHAGESVLTLDREEHLKHVTFGYVLALAARLKPALTVLDYGGNLGDYYWVARAMVSNVDLEYHCKELPAVAEEGRQVTPAVVWHTDDDCLTHRYDLIVFSSSLQYLPEWQEVLRRAARTAGSYLFISDAPTVRQVPGYVVVQRSGGMATLYQPLNRSEILGVVESAGLRLVREFAMGEHYFVKNAPEQPVCAGWLFKRDP